MTPHEKVRSQLLGSIQSAFANTTRVETFIPQAVARMAETGLLRKEHLGALRKDLQEWRRAGDARMQSEPGLQGLACTDADDLLRVSLANQLAREIEVQLGRALTGSDPALNLGGLHPIQSPLRIQVQASTPEAEHLARRTGELFRPLKVDPDPAQVEALVFVPQAQFAATSSSARGFWDPSRRQAVVGVHASVPATGRIPPLLLVRAFSTACHELRHAASDPDVPMLLQEMSNVLHSTQLLGRITMFEGTNLLGESTDELADAARNHLSSLTTEQGHFILKRAVRSSLPLVDPNLKWLRARVDEMGRTDTRQLGAG